MDLMLFFYLGSKKMIIDVPSNITLTFEISGISYRIGMQTVVNPVVSDGSEFLQKLAADIGQKKARE